MSDLISRSELLKVFNDKNIQITFDLPVEEVLGEDVDLDDFAMLVQDAIQAYKKMVIDTIKIQPTAYDIGNVVEELEGAMWLTTNDDGETNNLSIQVVSFEDAIEIVNQGGVSDDLCETSADKIKVTSLEVIVTGSKRKPYYEIKYKEVGADHYNIGYSSYNLDFVLDWKDKCFELVKVVE